MLVDLERDRKEANETAAVCQRETHQCRQTTLQVQVRLCRLAFFVLWPKMRRSCVYGLPRQRFVLQIIADECERELKEALPAYNDAMRALGVLKRDHITVIKSFPNPPKPVQKVMEAVCILFGVGTTWEDAKRLLSKVRPDSDCEFQIVQFLSTPYYHQ